MSKYETPEEQPHRIIAGTAPDGLEHAPPARLIVKLRTSVPQCLSPSANRSAVLLAQALCILFDILTGLKTTPGCGDLRAFPQGGPNSHSCFGPTGASRAVPEAKPSSPVPSKDISLRRFVHKVSVTSLHSDTLYYLYCRSFVDHSILGRLKHSATQVEQHVSDLAWHLSAARRFPVQSAD